MRLLVCVCCTELKTQRANQKRLDLQGDYLDHIDLDYWVEFAIHTVSAPFASDPSEMRFEVIVTCYHDTKAPVIQREIQIYTDDRHAAQVSSWLRTSTQLLIVQGRDEATPDIDDELPHDEYGYDPNDPAFDEENSLPEPTGSKYDDDFPLGGGFVDVAAPPWPEPAEEFFFPNEPSDSVVEETPCNS